MKLRKLEIALEKIEGFESPNVHFEQYKTPAIVAAPFLHLAFMSGDISGKTVYDFGLRHRNFISRRGDFGRKKRCRN
jgi:Predicted RNA methylase